MIGNLPALSSASSFSYSGVCDMILLLGESCYGVMSRGGPYMSLILPILGHALATIRAFEVNQIFIAGKAIVLDAAF